MGKIDRFEDMIAWQLARKLVNAIYSVSNKTEFAKDFGTRDQIRRAASSVMHNIAEGFDAGSDAEFIRFLRYSLRSASETQSHLYTALDQGYIKKKQFDELYKKADVTKIKLHGFIGYLVRNKSRRKLREKATFYDA